jgi:hypothetical protein
MRIDLGSEKPIKELSTFWWVFVLRGGFAVLFSAVLCFAGNLLGTAFFDPVMLILFAVLLGSYVLGNGVLLGVAAWSAFEHQLGIWWLLLAECIFAAFLGSYIGFSLLLTAQSIAILAGIHALGVGMFQAVLTVKLHRHRGYATLLSVSALIAVGVGAGFLLHRTAGARALSFWLSGFELIYGASVITFALGLRSCRPVPSSMELRTGRVLATPDVS